MQSILIHVGRSLLALYFLLPGISKFTSWDMHVTLMETHNMSMVPVLLALAGVTQIGASLCLFLNKQVVGLCLRIGCYDNADQFQSARLLEYLSRGG